MPRAAVALPARDSGWPYLARFSGVSGTGPFVTIVVVTLAPWPKLVAEVAVAPVVEVVTSPGVVVVVLDDVVSADGGGASSAGRGWSLVVVVVVEVVALASVDVGGVAVVEVVWPVWLGSLVGVDGLVVVFWSGVADEVDWATAAPAIRAEAAAAVARIFRVMGV